jgi:type IV pilus assembly protein PilY1
MAHRNRLTLKVHLKTAAILVGLATLFFQTSIRAEDNTFSSGSLIIPMQSNFQDSCGVTSAYGLVWQILRANQPGHYFANINHNVTVYVVINGKKTSHNRCVPSNLSPAPGPNAAGPSGAANHWDDPKWNDGCDLAITSQNQQPVVPVDYNANPPWPASGKYPYGDIPWLDTSSLAISGISWGNGWDFASPKVQRTTLNNTVTPAFTTVQYMGAPFVIDAADAPYVMQFLRSGDAYTDPAYLKRFTATTDPVSALTACPNGGTTPSADYHHVNIHQAMVQFTGTVGRRLNMVPPKIALLDTGAGVKWYGYAGAGGIRVLDMYLKNANLFFTGSVGCPPGSFAGCTLNGGQPGQIYDQFHAYADLISTSQNPYGLLNALDSNGKPLYRIFWAPHWETSNMNPWVGSNWDTSQNLTPNYAQYLANGDGATTQQQNAYNNVAYFADQLNHGLMAECASLAAYEGQQAAPVAGSTRFLFSNGITVNGLNIGFPSPGFDGRNCSDPSYSSGDCVLYDQAATNPFSQLGDYHFIAQYGVVANFAPWSSASPASAYKTGVSRLAVSWNNYSSGSPPNLATYQPTGSNGWDFFDFGYKRNDTRKGVIVYIAGHEYSDSTAGNRIVLNTLLHMGFLPTGGERALSHPVAYYDPNGATDAQKALVLASTYTALNGLPPGASQFDYNYASKWRFPYIQGHLRAHSLLGANQLVAGENDFAAATLWDADAMLPLPGNRNLFTYLGGYIKGNPSSVDLGGSGRAAANNVAQLGWVPANIAGTAIGTGCVDVMKLGTAADGSCGMVPGSDGICDLQEALQYTQLNLGTDCGVAEVASNQALLANSNTLNATQQMLQVVRGFCAATTNRMDGPNNTPILAPADNQCNDIEGVQLNRAHLGGLVHSSPAIIPPSPNINDGSNSRPTMSYVAGLDGQIHAFYVSGGDGYNPPAGVLNFLNPPANSAFVNDWSAAGGGFRPPAPGTELWAYMPVSQLPWLQTSGAQVDSSPVVQDVFIDLVGRGVREWHTVLVASVGGLNREVVALDISNPLKPVLLWDLAGSLRRSGQYPYYSPTILVNAGVPSGAGRAARWREPDAAFNGPCNGTSGCDLTGVYDFTGFGGGIGHSIGEFRRGLEPVTAVFVATNSSGANGIPAGLEVFAIDIGSGQKLWEWVEPYSVNTYADNTVPPPASILRSPDGAVRVYAGDMEGKVWELDSATGMNVNVYFDPTLCPSGCKFPAFSTQSTVSNQQPVTTNLALARIPNLALSSPSVFAPFANSNILVIGTAGANWVPFTYPGQLHVLFLDDRYRKPYKTAGSAVTDSVNGLTQSQLNWINSSTAGGVLMEKSPPFPMQFTNAHLYGSVTVSGQMVFFETTRDRVPQDINWLQGTITGGTYSIDLGAATSSVTGDGMTAGFGSLASYGGVTVYHDTSTATPTDYVLSAEVSKIARTSMGSSTAAAKTGTLDPNSRGTGVFYSFKGLLQRFFDSSNP